MIFAGDQVSTDSSIGQAIDHFVESRLAEEGVEAAPVVSDEAFLRRLSLDLAGRIPTAKELSDFLELPEEQRRQQAINAFLDQPDYAFHQANEIDVLLLARLKQDNDWRKFLLQACQENRSWDHLFRQLMIPEIEFPDNPGPAAYLRERVRELDDLTNDTAVLFFGVNIGCAKCHDHPLVIDWEQDHYFGMASFFKRTYLTKSRMLAEDFRGDVKFTNILGEEKQAVFKFLSNATVEEPETELQEELRKQLEEAVKQSKKDDKVEAPEVPFRPRSEFVKLALADDEKEFFARNIVNRIWARLMGRGLVMPLDQMHSENPPSHPELMDWLVNDLKSNQYDLKRLITGIVSSQAYARSCRWSSKESEPSPDLFAVGNVRPLNPRQLSLSLLIAGQNQELLPGLEKSEDWQKQREDLENRSAGFANLLPIPDEGFQVGTEEALLFANGERFTNDYLKTGNDSLIGQLKNIEAPQEQVSVAFQTILTRKPSHDEQVAIEGYLAERIADEDSALRQIVWALFASPEFRFNH